MVYNYILAGQLDQEMTDHTRRLTSPFPENIILMREGEGGKNRELSRAKLKTCPRHVDRFVTDAGGILNLYRGWRRITGVSLNYNKELRHYQDTVNCFFLEIRSKIFFFPSFAYKTRPYSSITRSVEEAYGFCNQFRIRIRMNQSSCRREYCMRGKKWRETECRIQSVLYKVQIG